MGVTMAMAKSVSGPGSFESGRRRLLLGRVSLFALGTAAMAAGVLVPERIAVAAESTGIEEIVVTAQKKEEKAQDVPISIGVISGQQIEKQGIINIDDLAARTPNVQAILPFGPQEPQFSVRGVTETDFQPSQSSPIAVYVDGVFKSVGALQALQLYDTDRIETLKGPQGTIEGRNATGGAINIYTTPPSLDGFSGSVMVGIGNFGRYETNGDLNVPVTDTLAIRGAWTFTNVDGYFRNDLPDAPDGGNLTGVFDYGFRLSALWKPTDDLKFVLRVSSARSDPVNYGEYSEDICCGGQGIPPGVLTAQPNGDYSYYVTNTGQTIPQSFYQPTGYYRQGLSYDDTQVVDVHRREIKSHGFSLTGDYQMLDWLKLTSVTGYDQGQWNTVENDGGAPFNTDEAVYFSRVHSFQEEIRATSSFDGPYNFIAGALYDQESLYLSENTQWAYYQKAIYVAPDGSTANICLISGFYACDLFNSLNQKRSDYAAYLNNTVKIFDTLQATIGARYTADSVSFQNYTEGLTYIDNTNNNQTVYVNTEPYGAPFGVNQPNQTATDHKWIGKAGLDYHITPDNMVYASWSLGFRGSAFNAAAQFVPTNSVKPETLIDYEIGSKNTFLDNRLQANFGAFYYVYRNQQFATLGSNGLSAEINVGKLHTEGVEADLQAKPLPNLKVSLNGGYLYSIYGDGTIANPQQHIYEFSVAPFVNITGDRVYTSPRWSASTQIDWTIFDTDYGSLNWYLDGNAITREYFNAANSPNSLQGGYTLWDTRLTWEYPDPDVAVSAWMMNMFDRQYSTVIFDTNALLNYSFGERGTPRTFGVSATWRFGGGSPEAPAETAPPPPPPPEPAPPPPAVEAKRSFQVFFDFDKSDITAAAAKVIQAAADAVKSGNIVQITVTGHTDTVGSASYNQALSERRAAAVKTGLVADGVSAGEITTIGAGKTGLLVPTADGVREPQNRRAEIVLQ
jgi:iron complex outermembrane receptor protein